MAAPLAGGGLNPGVVDALSSSAGAPAAGGLDQQAAELRALMGQLRDLDNQIDTIMGQVPALGNITQQMHALIKQAVKMSVQMAPAQTPSGEALPTGGM